MSAEDKFQAKYSQHLQNLQMLSYDDKNNESLCQNTVYKYYNFDKIVREEDKNSGYTPASPDALIFKGKTIYCVEFKNSFENHIKDKNIRNKAKNGYEVLSNIFTKLELKITDYELIFCVVHKGRKEEDIWSSLKYKQKKRSIQFDLEQYRGSLFADIFTNDIDFFKGQFIKKIDQNLSC